MQGFSINVLGSILRFCFDFFLQVEYFCWRKRMPSAFNTQCQIICQLIFVQTEFMYDVCDNMRCVCAFHRLHTLPEHKLPGAGSATDDQKWPFCFAMPFVAISHYLTDGFLFNNWWNYLFCTFYHPRRLPPWMRKCLLSPKPNSRNRVPNPHSSINILGNNSVMLSIFFPRKNLNKKWMYASYLEQRLCHVY